MKCLPNRQNTSWFALVSAVVVMVAGVAILNNQQQQQRLQAEAQVQAAQDQANRESMQRRQGELALKNELESASQREATLQPQLKEMDAGVSRLQAAR